jgi:hypothetical protein
MKKNMKMRSNRKTFLNPFLQSYNDKKSGARPFIKQ